MRVGLSAEADIPAGGDLTQRYEDMLHEVELADELGFDFYGVSEQHFNNRVAFVSAPEVLFGAVAARTKWIKVRHTSVVLLPMNHPIRVAERVATLDVISKGRAQLGTARSNNLKMLQTFGVPAIDTRRCWEESLELIRHAFTTSNLEFHGEIWDVPEATLVPEPVQKPHPPIFVAATSLATHGIAGQKGIGVMTGNSLPGGWSYMAEAVKLYKDSFDEGAANGIPSNAMATAVQAHCAETTEQAYEEAREAALGFVHTIIGWYKSLSKESPDYAYLSKIEDIVDRKDDLPHLIERAPYLTIGTPDFFVERIRYLEELGFDEIMLRVDGMGHDVHMRAIELIGTEVIPKVKAEAPVG
jgi:alkanesulfonate monooxygenase SsuD/methylene tetrahydromethanopterin reductase-like flavin-dependent oxidoreductase (luciferase family)